MYEFTNMCVLFNIFKAEVLMHVCVAVCVAECVAVCVALCVALCVVCVAL